MPARILSGTDAADALLQTLVPKVRELSPTLTILQVGDDASSNAYIKRKKEACEKIGIACTHRQFKDDVSFETLMGVIEELNGDPRVTGFILQTPLPPHLVAQTPLLMKAIDPQKDVDGATAYNLGKVFLSTEFEHLPPATPAGIVTLLEHYEIHIEGRHVVIVGRSNVVGKPLAVMLLNRSATVTVCHSKSADLAFLTRQADILVSAVGKSHLITADMVKPGAVVIDVGLTREDGKLTGDIDFEHVQEIASAITPVPGGIGPMTVASVLRNCVRAAERQQ